MSCDKLVIENYMGGNFFSSKRHLDSFEPNTGKAYAKVPDSGKLEADAAVSAALRAFPEWSALSAASRANYLFRIADIIESRLEEFAQAESRDQGKPLYLSRNVDIPRVVKNFRHFAETVPHAMETSKQLIDQDCVSFTSRDPVGVAVLISPWNLPLYLLTFKIAPALACGNTIVAKPSEMTSLTAYMLCKVFDEVDLPAGVANVVFGTGPNVGDALVSHPNVSLVSFTGSTATGKLIAAKASPSFKKLSLELGGKNAAVIFPDCDVSEASTTLLRSCFINSGQVCLCTSRVFVHRTIFDDFLSLFVEKTRNLKVGPFDEKGVFMRALNSKQHLDKVRSYVKLARDEGATIECGESVPGDSLILPAANKEGYFMLPTIITGVKDDSRIMQEEVFGPVTCVVPFDDEKEVAERANNTPYGLCASVWTNNLGIAHRMSKELEVGTVWVNCWMVRDMDLPFGGMKCSGVGREGTKDSYEFFTKSKTCCVNIKKSQN